MKRVVVPFGGAAKLGSYHGETWRFRRALVLHALEASGGNRTLAANRLDLQRTYLLRLMRELQINEAPPAPYSTWPVRRGVSPRSRSGVDPRSAASSPNRQG